MTAKDVLPPPYSETPPAFEARRPEPQLPPRCPTRHVIPRKPVNVVNLASTAATAREALQLPIRELPRPEYLPEGVINPSQTQQQPSTNGDSSTVATLQYGFREFKHFAGGLLHHPAESTKHFSILRHSSGLSKGWTGHTGLKAKALLRSNAAWIDVTPGGAVDATKLAQDDERAWQRDIRGFQRKATGSIANHHIRATALINIPVGVQDGYWRLVLCDQKKRILCPSPVFRIASSSSSPASLRGASLGNLPLEIGASIVSSIAAAHASGLAQGLISTVQGAIPYQPSFIEQEAGTLVAGEVYSRSGAEDRIDSANAAYETARQNAYVLRNETRGTATLTDRYVDTRQQAMRIIDKVPTERLGIRMRKDELEGRTGAASGVYIWRG